MTGHYEILVQSGPLLGKKFRFDQEVTKVGRNVKLNDLVINDQSVSSEHVSIVYLDGKFFIRDNNSTNGTKLNARTVSSNQDIELKNNDKIEFGTVTVLFTLPSANRQSATTENNGLAQTQVMGGGKAKPREKRASTIPPLRKRLYLISALVLLSLAMLTVIKPNKVQTVISDGIKKSDQLISLPADGSYGPSFDNKQSLNFIAFSFTVKKGRSVLYYTLKGTGSSDEVTISLNGLNLASVALSTKGWGEEAHLNFPRKLIISEGENKLEFRQSQSTKDHGTWAVKKLFIEFTPDKECDVQGGKRFFDLGEEMLREKRVNDENLYLAMRYYSEAISLSALCREEPPFYPIAENKYLQAKEEIDDKYHKMIFFYNKYSRLRNYPEAERFLSQIPKFIPNESDRRVITAKKLFTMNQKMTTRAQ